MPLDLGPSQRKRWTPPFLEGLPVRLHSPILPVLAVAVTLRTLALVLMFRAAPDVWFYDQASELTCLARSIRAGHGLSSPFCGSTGPSAFLAPGYPLLVALVYRLLGVSSLRAAVLITALQALFGLLTVLMVMLVAKRLFGPRTSCITGFLCAISPTMVLLPALFWETSLSTLLLTGVILFALHCIDRPGPGSWIGIGAFSAFAMYVNPSLLITFIGVGVWAAYATRNLSRKAPWLAVGAFTILFSVWPIRNALALHAFIPLRSNLGYELWQGNRPGSEGLFNPRLYLNANLEEYSRYATIGELPYMQEKQTIAIATIKADPLRFARLSMKRAGIFWTALGGHDMSRAVIAEITGTSLCSFVSLAILLRRRYQHATLFLLPVLLFPLPYYGTHPDFRFRLLLEPIALLLTSWLINTAYELLTTRRAVDA